MDDSGFESFDEEDGRVLEQETISYIKALLNKMMELGHLGDARAFAFNSGGVVIENNSGDEFSFKMTCMISREGEEPDEPESRLLN